MEPRNQPFETDIESAEAEAEAAAVMDSAEADSTPGASPETDLVPPQVMLGYVIPPGVIRMKVLDEKGEIRWRKIGEAHATDAPSLSLAGQPVFLRRPLGRPQGSAAYRAAQAAPTNLHDALPPTTTIAGDLIKIKIAQMRVDPILQVVEDSPESPEVLDQAMSGIAEECSSLRFERMEAERQGKDASTLSMRRIQGLKALGDTWLKRKEQISIKVVDIESPAFEKLFKFIVESFTRAMQNANLRDEQADSVIAEFAKMLDDAWKNEAKGRMVKE